MLFKKPIKSIRSEKATSFSDLIVLFPKGIVKMTKQQRQEQQRKREKLNTERC